MTASSPKRDRALASLQAMLDAGRLPHALLLVGAPRGTGGELARRLIARLYALPAPDATLRHPDIHWLEPQGKGRVFPVSNAPDKPDVIRPEIQFLAQTSNQGGWKTVVFLFADRLSEIAQNVLLKTIEEPPPNSLLLLVTASPAALLATIRSRVQLIDVADDAVPDAPWVADLLSALRNPPSVLGYAEILAYADALGAPLRDFKAQAEAEEAAAAEAEAAARGLEKLEKNSIDERVATRVQELREDWFRVLLQWAGDLLLAANASPAPRAFPGDAPVVDALAARMSPPALLNLVRAIDRARELLTHNIREPYVLPRLARALIPPPAPSR